MRIHVKAKTNSKKEFIKKVDSTHFIVAVNKPAIEGKANKAIEKALADYFNTSPSRVMIVSGEKSKEKVVEIIS